MNQQELNEILAKHKLWLNGNESGVCADLSGADLRRANLSDADLIITNLPVWTAYIHADTVRIGCQHNSHDAWLSFTDDESR